MFAGEVTLSRSRKQPYHTDQNSGKPQYGRAKRVASRAVRDAIDVPSGGAYKKYSCSWDIRDWAWYAPKDKKAYRK